MGRKRTDQSAQSQKVEGRVAVGGWGEREGSQRKKRNQNEGGLLLGCVGMRGRAAEA